MESGNWLLGKHILITGGSSGFGREMASALIGTARKITLVARDKDNKLENIQRELLDRNKSNRNSAQNTQVDIVRLDVRDYAGMRKLVAQIYTSGDQVDIFYICAGGSHVYLPFEQMSCEDMDQIFDVNAKAPLYWLRELLPRMRTNKMPPNGKKRGQVVVMSSRSGERVLPKLSVYAAAKGAMESMMEAMQKEYSAYELVFTLMNPGSVKTDFTVNWPADLRNEHNNESIAIEEAIRPVLLAMSVEYSINKISYESVLQWKGEPGVLPRIE